MDNYNQFINFPLVESYYWGDVLNSVSSRIWVNMVFYNSSMLTNTSLFICTNKFSHIWEVWWQEFERRLESRHFSAFGGTFTREVTFQPGAKTCALYCVTREPVATIEISKEVAERNGWIWKKITWRMFNSVLSLSCMCFFVPGVLLSFLLSPSCTSLHLHLLQKVCKFSFYAILGIWLPFVGMKHFIHHTASVVFGYSVPTEINKSTVCFI